MKSKKSFLCFVFIFAFYCSGSCLAAEKNAVDLNVNASGVKEGANVIYLTSSEMELKWTEKVYYEAKTSTTAGVGSFHCAMTIKNTGKSDGDLYVKIDFLMPSDTTAFEMPNNLTGYYKWCYFDTSGTIPVLGLSNTKRKLATLGAEQSISLFDFVASNTFQYHGPILVTAIMLDASGTLLGVDSEMIFFNTEFKNWIRTHAAP